MKPKFYVALFGLCILIMLVSCNRMLIKLNVADMRKLVLDYSYVRINDTLYACQYEVTNQDYKTFLENLPCRDSGMHAFCAIDSNQWKNVPYAYKSNLAMNYFNHPAFKRYPVCCISWAGAGQYCKWLTQILNKDPNKPKVIFRLPTPAEWMLLSSDPKSFDTGYPGGFDASTNCYRFNFDTVDKATNTAEDGGYYTVKVDSYSPNRKGMYNLSGNVAEMTSDSMVCKGGGWSDPYKDCRVSAVKHYSLPNPAVGFRVIAIIH